MNITELFSSLAYGELSNLALSGDGNGLITPAKKPQLVYFINEALIDIHTKFNLKEDTLMLRIVEGKTQYFLDKAFSSTGFDPQVADFPYIEDSVSWPFKGYVLKVLSIDSSSGCSRPINDSEHIYSVFLPKPKELQVPFFGDDEMLAVHYQALPEPVGIGVDDNAEIVLPSVLHNALRAYVASKVYGTMNTVESLTVSQMHMANYASLCSQIVEYDSLNLSTSTTSAKFHTRGWV